MKTIARSVLKWTDKKYDEAMAVEGLTAKSAGKAFISGAVEGVIDGLVVVGAATCVLGVIAGVYEKMHK